MGSDPRFWEQLRDNRSGLAGLLIVAIYFMMAAGVWGGLLGQDWSSAGGDRWAPPGAEAWFGTNLLGQDIFQRSIYSVRTAFEIGLVVSVLSTLLGAILGAVAGWYGKTWADGSVLWLAGVLDSIPFYLFVAAVAFAFASTPW